MSDDEERWRNFALFKVWATDEEMGILGMVIVGLVVIGAIGYGIYRLVIWL